MTYNDNEFEKNKKRKTRERIERIMRVNKVLEAQRQDKVEAQKEFQGYVYNYFK